MKSVPFLALLGVLPLAAAEPGWTSLFNGKDLTGWKVNENVETFSVKDGAIVAHGKRSHCFYMGEFRNHSFKDFELMVEVKTEPKANGGVYIMTEFQPEGWPGRGFEVQVNNTYVGDPRRTASLYEVKDTNAEVAKDNEWFTEHVIAKGNNIKVYVGDKLIVDWTQPAGWNGTKSFVGRRIGPGTIALQGHDPGSTVHYRNIRIRPLD